MLLFIITRFTSHRAFVVRLSRDTAPLRSLHLTFPPQTSSSVERSYRSASKVQKKTFYWRIRRLYAVSTRPLVIVRTSGTGPGTAKPSDPFNDPKKSTELVPTIRHTRRPCPARIRPSNSNKGVENVCNGRDVTGRTCCAGRSKLIGPLQFTITALRKWKTKRPLKSNRNWNDLFGMYNNV